jgi:SAM-dependent methyltransferase
VHRSSFDKMLAFREGYLGEYTAEEIEVLDVGSAAVSPDSGTYRSLFSPPWRYVGLDTAPALNVDVAVADPYVWSEFSDGAFDVVVSGQAFEHIAWPWLTILEIARVLKVNGLAVIAAPTAGAVHRYPLDCWRFYPDGIPALAAFAGLRVVETHTDERYAYPECAHWGDVFTVMQRDPRSPKEEQAWSVRGRALQVAVGLAPRQPSDRPVLRSVIAPAADRQVFRRREDLRLAELSPFKVKADLLRAAVQRMRTILRTPLSALTRA